MALVISRLDGQCGGVRFQITVADEDEETPGGYVGANDDDDNDNCTPDNSDTGPVTGEDDLVAVSLSVSPSVSVGEAWVTFYPYDTGAFNVWEEVTKINEVTHNTEWLIASMPSTLYVEGVGDTSEREVALTLNYGCDTGSLDHNDDVYFTVVRVNMGMTGVWDDEETCKGGYIALNDDDDNNNCIADRDDTGTVNGEDDLVEITLDKVQPETLTGEVTLKVLSGGSNIKVWTTSTKGTEITLPKTYSTPADLPKNLYVEGYSASGSVRDVTLALEFTVGGQTFDDRIKATVVKVDLDASEVDDRKEICEGQWVPLNGDNDNNNTTADKDESGTVTGEDDLVMITLAQVIPNELTGVVTLKPTAGGSKIKVWTNSTKGTEITLPETYSTPADLPKYLYLEGYSDSSSVRDVELALEFTVEGKTLADNLKVTVYRTELKSIKFTSDHGLLSDNNSDWTDSGTTYTEPEWIPDGLDSGSDPDQNNPVSHTKDVNLTVDVTVRVGPSGLSFDLAGDGADNYVDFTKTGNTGTSADQIISITADAPLPDMVDTLAKNVAWTIKLNDPNPQIERDVGSSGAHTIYVTYGTPSGSVVTEYRMSWACTTANAESTPIGIADESYTDFETPPPYFELGADAPDPLWLLMAGSVYKGECIDQANLMRLAVQILGASASIGYIYGSSDTTCYSSSSDDYETRTCPGGSHGSEEIIVWAAGGWNNWEAVCVVDSDSPTEDDKYYAVQLDSDTVAVNILRTWLGSNTPPGNYQAWVYPPGGTTECGSPGPHPVPKP